MAIAANPQTTQRLDLLSINAIRFLSVDAVEKANSGHPGLPLGAAPMAYVLWTRFLKHNPANPRWFDRDRFVLSAGHGSMLLYSLLHLTGYDLPMEQIQQFRQWGSITPGHPEFGVTPGVEITTGPLGQGFGNGVGMAIAEAHLAARYNRPGFELIRHFTYGIVSDGDLMEGVAAEAASLAGHLRLGRLIYLYDDNRVSLAASTDLTFTEDRLMRFEAYGWHTLSVNDGNDLDAIQQAIEAAREETQRPSLIRIRTHIGYGAPTKQDTFEAHGSPLGEEEVREMKSRMNWPVDRPFYVPEEALRHFREAVDRGREAEQQWNQQVKRFAKAFPEQAKELDLMMSGRLPSAWADAIPEFSGDSKPMATRVASGKALNALAAKLPGLIGGSADLNPSTYTEMKGLGDFESPLGEGEAIDRQGAAGGGWNYAGRNLHFGVREHAMGAILSGLAAHGGLIPFGATFMNFSDYMRPTIRLASMMSLQVIYLFTHDSIGLGEDGPTHQPIEQLVSLRAIPSLIVIRPADANETAAAWRIAIEERKHPTAMVLSRQKLPVFDPAKHPQIAEGVRLGAYILAPIEEDRRPDIILVSTGSEVHLALAAREQLLADGIHARVVSMPSWNLFERQPEEYRSRVFVPGVPLLAIEAGATLGWQPYVGPRIEVISIERFGASAPGEEVLHKYGFSVENIVSRARTMLASSGSSREG